MNNLKNPVQLDVTLDSDWKSLSDQLNEDNAGLFSGVVVCESTMKDAPAYHRLIRCAQAIFFTVRPLERRTTSSPTWATQMLLIRRRLECRDYCKMAAG